VNSATSTVFVVLVTALWPHACLAQEKQITNVVLISTVQHFEKRIERIQYKCQIKNGFIADLKDIKTVNWKESECMSSVILEPRRGRVRVEVGGAAVWGDGSSPHLGYHEGLSFDGETQRELNIQRPGKVAAKSTDHNGDGKITDDFDFWLPKRPGKHVQYWLGMTGIKFFPPYLFAKKLSALFEEIIEQKKRLEITESSNGKWSITIDPDPDFAGIVRLVYDPNHGVVTLIEYEVERGEPKEKLVWEKIQFEFDETKNGFWVPRQINIINFLGGYITRWDFKDVAINEPVSDDVFRLTFPTGTRVFDDIKKTTYQVGMGSGDDEAAVLAYARFHGLPFDETPPSFVSKYKFRLLGIAIFSVATAGVVYFKRRRGGSKMTLVIAFWCSSVSMLMAGEDKSDAKNVVNKRKSESIQESQCGWNVTALVLSCFAKENRWDQMVAAIPSAECGTRFSDIKMWLEANGLACEARKNVSLKLLGTSLPVNTAAIFPIKANNDNHYVVVIHHPQKGKLFLNPPGSPPAPLLDAVDNPFLEPMDGIVLLISQNSKGGQQASALRIASGDHIKLGKISLDSPNSSKADHYSVRITNDSDRPILVSRLTTSCGCVNPEWMGGMLRPKEAREVSFGVSKGAWGDGYQERETAFVMADKSAKTITWSGEGVSERGERGLTIATSTVWISESNALPARKQIDKDVGVKFEDPNIPDPEPRSKAKWLKVSFQRKSRESGLIKIQILPALMPGQDVVEGIVSVSEKSPAHIKVVFNRQSFCRLVPDSMEFSKNEQTRMLEIVPAVSEEKGQPKLQKCELVEVPSGLHAQVTGTDSGKIIVSCRNDRLSLGIHFLRLQVTDQNANRAFLTMLVRVGEKPTDSRSR
jgi:hypothetical protein